MARKPQPGGDTGKWGNILNEFLDISHNADGTIKNSSVTSGTIADGAVSEVKLDDTLRDKVNAVAAGGATNLSVTTAAASVVVASDTGSDATLTAATSSVAGVLSAADKTKLDSIQTGAQANTVTSVASKTGAVTLTKADVGLSNVDNTADASKPISTAVQTALSGKASASHSHAIADVTSLQTTLDSKAASNHSHSLDNLSDVSTAGATSGQSLVYQSGSWGPATVSSGGGVTDHGALTGLSDDDHPQYINTARGDARYYTQSQLDTSLAGKASSTHTHTVDNLSNVTISSPSSGQVLKYNGTAWTNQADSTGGGGTGFTIVHISPTADGEIYNASDGDWVLVNCGANNFGLQVVLPAPVANARVRVKKTDTTTLAIIVTGPFSGGSYAKVDPPTGANSLNYTSASQDYMSDGINWYMV